jgi:hypothetical protein
MIWDEHFILPLFNHLFCWGGGGGGMKKHMQSSHILVDTNLAISKIVQRSHSQNWIKGEEKQCAY